MLKEIFSILIPSPAILHTFSCIYRSRQLAVFPELWIYVSSQVHGTLVSRTRYTRSDGLHFFLLCHRSQFHFNCFLSENIDTQILVVQPFSQSKNFFEEELQPTVFVETFKNERLYWISLIIRAGFFLSLCLQTSLGDLRPSCSPSRCNCPDFHFSRMEKLYLD